MVCVISCTLGLFEQRDGKSSFLNTSLIFVQGMFQGGYAGQPQPGGTPPSSAGSTPANQSNPYARPGGQGPFSGYPKPAQNYPNYNK